MRFGYLAIFLAGFFWVAAAQATPIPVVTATGDTSGTLEISQFGLNELVDYCDNNINCDASIYDFLVDSQDNNGDNTFTVTFTPDMDKYPDGGISVNPASGQGLFLRGFGGYDFDGNPGDDIKIQSGTTVELFAGHYEMSRNGDSDEPLKIDFSGDDVDATTFKETLTLGGEKYSISYDIDYTDGVLNLEVTDDEMLAIGLLNVLDITGSLDELENAPEEPISFLKYLHGLISKPEYEPGDGSIDGTLTADAGAGTYVPLPATIALLPLGLAGIFVTRRRW